MINYPIAPQRTSGNGRHLIEIIAARVDHGQLGRAHILRIIFRVAIRQAHVALDREQIGEQPTGEHDDQAGVSEMNSQFPPGKPETFYVRGNKINQQHSADEMPARENRDLESPSLRRPPHKHTLEITLLRFLNPEISAIAAARQKIVSFSDVIRSTSLWSMLLKLNRFDEFHEIRFLFFHRCVRPGCFEEPDTSVAPRPSGNSTLLVAGDVGG